jgi:holo-[acyl-carrier protein] synthase
VATLGVGVDVVDVARFRELLERREGLADRLFTAQEREDSNDAPERLAARFCAKEATLKALGVGLGHAWHDIVVLRLPSGAPTLVLTGEVLELATVRGVRSWHLSLSHSDATATAYVIATDEEGK